MKAIESGSKLTQQGGLARGVKRSIDIVASLVLLVLTSPILLVASIATITTSGLPFLYRQQRIGLHEKPFTLFKLRTMRTSSGNQIELLTDDERVTKIGRLIRLLSIDELPQLWNVLRGDMSLVGPRPLLDVHLNLMDASQRIRHSVRPGITGLAQIHGRSALRFSERFRLDTTYSLNWTVGTDLRIICRTVIHLARPHRTTTQSAIDDIDDIGLSTAIQELGSERERQ